MAPRSRLGTSSGASAADWYTVISQASGRAGRRSAVLRVDQDHPFFFDHPLDHVSGMLLITGLLDLVRAAADPHLGLRGGHRVRLRLKFVKICELDERVVLFAEPDPDGGAGWAVRAVQGDDAVCHGTVELVREPDVTPLRPVAGGPVPPIASDLVHRVDQDNVLLGEPLVSDAAYVVPLVPPVAGHFLRRHGEDRYPAEELIEAGRLLLTALSHVAYEHPRDIKMLWLTLTADLPGGAPRSAPLELHWPVREPSGNRGYFDFDVVPHGATAPVGYVHNVIKYLTPGAYHRLRGPRA